MGEGERGRVDGDVMRLMGCTLVGLSCAAEAVAFKVYWHGSHDTLVCRCHVIRVSKYAECLANFTLGVSSFRTCASRFHCVSILFFPNLT